MGKWKEQSAQLKHYSAKLKTHIQPYLLTDPCPCRMVCHAASYSWDAACRPKFLSCIISSDLTCEMLIGKEINHDKRHEARDLPPLTTSEQIWVRDQKWEGQVIGVAKQPRSYLMKADMSTPRHNWPALVAVSSQPATSSHRPTVIPSNLPSSAPLIPPNVSTPKAGKIPAETATPTAPTTANPAQEDHPDTEDCPAHLSAMEAGIHLNELPTLEEQLRHHNV